MIVPFYSAAINGTAKFIQVHRWNPKKAMIRGGVITTISLMNYVMNRDDEEYWDQPQWLRDFAWLMPTKGTPLYRLTPFIPIPKPFLWGVMYSTIPERVMKWIDDNENDPTGQGAFDDLANTLAQNALPPVIPAFIKPVVEAYFDYNIFQQRPLTPGYIPRDLDPTYKMTPYTSLWSKQTAIALKKIGIHVSPIHLDNTLYGYTAGMGKTVSNTIDMIFGSNRPAPQIADIPLVRAFGVRQHSGNTESVNQFYKRFEKLQRKETTQKFAVQNGIKLKPGERLTAPEEFELGKLKTVNREMNKFRKQIRDITASKALSPQEKRRRIDNANIQIVRLARETVCRKTRRKQREEPTVRSGLRTPAREPVVRREGLAAGVR